MKQPADLRLLLNPSLIEQSAEQLIRKSADFQNAISLVEQLQDENGVFWAQEDSLFDYKRDYPQNLGDEYFAGICRLIFGFYNSFGGIVVVGVDDQCRTSGHNKKTIDIERLNTRLRELSEVSINVRHLHVDHAGAVVDLLVVPKRKPNVPPVVLKKQLGKYEKGMLWFRQGHEVLEAESRNISFLFGPREGNVLTAKLQNFMPPSPSTIGRFVGRIDVLSQLLNWVSSHDQPRAFLWGRGGSGKSTIAHEFASILRDFGSRIKTVDGTTFDRVIFLSAKEQELNTLTGKIQDTKDVDFENYEGILRAILIAADYSATEDFSELNKAGLEERVKEVFSHENVFIVFDDIDTLITKKQEAGFDALFMMAIRAKQTIRMLYTQRNEPVSAESSIQVTGFTKENEYQEFVKNCCNQFQVPIPDAKYLNNDLKETTEAIPLIVETIIRLRKVTGTYQKAHEIFLERRGEEARKYLFEREYQSLPGNNNARHVLAAIGEFGNPVGNPEISTIIRIGDGAIADSIGQLIGFFLSTVVSNEGETKYFLNPVTRTFIRGKTSELKFGETIRERVKAFKSAGQKKPKEVVIVESEVDRFLSKEQFSDALSLVTRPYSVRVAENPAFRSLRAIVYAMQSTPMIAEAREDFQYCVDQGYEDANGMRNWLIMERTHGHSHKNQLEICDHVINGKSYADSVKMEFKARRSVVCYFKGRDSNHSDAFDLYSEALLGHVEAYSYFWITGADVTWNYKSVRNTAFSLVHCARQIDYDNQLVKVFRQVHSSHGQLAEPLYDPLIDACRFLAEERGGDIGKRRVSVLKNLRNDLKRGAIVFENTETTQRCIRTIEAISC
ncbi:NB-ARC domain-containing protein [Aliiroseovarius sp. S2029]|uniref:RNA-binding domain-containing protein n=1 Tax=Aliiroseovarius sp. S2029 TaxID=2936988 RepID=UPI0020BF80B6|nr:RNA-binding domain-containing protein [Aliiroseovarius sp. S2029]MCK8484191.1 NB-ARC domain-containing protein [Aliiroseovarius sp. S2029]